MAAKGLALIQAVGITVLLGDGALAQALPANQPITATEVAANTTDSQYLWTSHYSYDAATALRQAGVIDAMKGHSPLEWMKQGELIDLLVKVTGNEIPVTETYDKEKLVTRGEVAKWVATFTRFNTGIAGNVKPPFKDWKDGDPFSDGIAYAYHTGIMAGDGTYFFPQERLTWGQGVIVLQHVLQRMPQMAKSLPFTKLENHFPDNVYPLIQENRTEAGIYTVTDGDDRYIIVADGEKPTGGYSVNIEGIYESKNGIFVKTASISPAPGSIVPMIITYPVAVAKIKATNKPIYRI